ncbi:hypothetical protein [Chitinilyticum piscinae]|uniref:Lipoprotein n=1 Tax=Chitinilyticum piscinae TaxID=2866724 RepID=A0A8J7FLU9_9NEIS|nr:hypothetical protein [Chitinilyticum piscinae]MBE9608716.1 hypothetical protein [Chitinilyticum piscinae]
MNSRLPRLLLVAAAIAGLSACEQASELTKQAASAVAGQVVSEVKNQTNEAISQFTSEADQVLAPLGIQSSAVASQMKAKAAELADQVLKAHGDWQVLAGMAGQTPAQLGLFMPVSPLMPELQKLLGDQLPAYLALMKDAGAIQASPDGVLYSLATAKNGDLGWLLIDPKNRKLEAGMQEGGKQQVFASQGEAIARPAVLAQQLTGK